MTRIETLKKHLAELEMTKAEIELKNKELKALSEVWKAKSEAFNMWLHLECGFEKDKTNEILMPEILLKWSQLN